MSDLMGRFEALIRDNDIEHLREPLSRLIGDAQTSEAELVLAGRPTWEQYFLGVAEAVSARGECVRSKVGAVIVRDNKILATGYNGAAPGMPSCLDSVCPRAQADVPSGAPYSGAGSCIAFHAEDNVIRDALRRGVDIEDAMIYITKEPCEVCATLVGLYQLHPVWP